jgi:predicted nucleic acid-binding protein
MDKVKVYLDTCCYNRPYDDQTQLRIELETKAKLFIQQQIIENKISLAVSIILEYENNDNPYELRKTMIKKFFENASSYIDESDEVVNTALALTEKGIKAKDASHLACAICAKCDYFLTTDDRLLKFNDDRIRIVNPVDFVIWEGITHE